MRKTWLNCRDGCFCCIPILVTFVVVVELYVVLLVLLNRDLGCLVESQSRLYSNRV